MGENKFFKRCPSYVSAEQADTRAYCWEHYDQKQIRENEIELQAQQNPKEKNDEWYPLGAFSTNNGLFEIAIVSQHDRLKELAEDDQNVHTPEVQQGVYDAIRRLEKWAIDMPIFKDLASVVSCEIDPDNDIHVQAIDHLKHCYLWNDDTRMFGTTYPKLASLVWHRVNREHENKDILISRFFEEVQESAGQCLNGNMARLMNVFAALDPEMSPQSDDAITASQLQHFISAASQLPSYEEAYYEVVDVLRRARIDEDKWGDWLGALKESFN